MDTAVLLPDAPAAAPVPDAGQGRARTVRTARPRLVRRVVHGVLLLDKPLEFTSHDALQKAKRLCRAEKGGHTGTLDPLATGLLPLCFGAATKFSQVSLDADKSYVATLRLGVTMTTGDLEGSVVATRPLPADLSLARIGAACAVLTGEIEQVPPMHSALKHEGRALYDYARAGIEVERPARRITIHRLDPLGWQGDVVEVAVTCSKGTYIRTLAEDLGAVLGCGAHLIALRRTHSGLHALTDAVTFDALEAMSEGERDACLKPVDTLLADWPAVSLDAAESARFLTGLRRRVGAADAPQVRVYGPPLEGHDAPAFLGSAHVVAGELIPTRLLSPQEVQGGPPAVLATSAASAPTTPIPVFQSLTSRPV